MTSYFFNFIAKLRNLDLYSQVLNPSQMLIFLCLKHYQNLILVDSGEDLSAINSQFLMLLFLNILVQQYL